MYAISAITIMWGDIPVIQYLYFYPYNHWWNRHEGDWQRIHVIVNTRHLHDNIDDIEVLGVEYLLHGAHLSYYDDYVMTFEIPPGVGGGGTTITESMPDLTTSLVFNPRENIKLSQGTHPIVYVGALLDDTAADPLADEEPVLAALTAASVRGLTATGARAGQRLRRVLKDAATGVRTAPLCFASRGFWLHAATRIAGPDRRGLERLCRYVARPAPALAGGRLRILDADHLSFALKTPWSDGTRPLLLSPMELLEKRAALVPPPRFHLLRYHGVLAPRARARERIVPAKPVAEPSAADGDASAVSCGHRLRWATLLARVFSSDISECAACGGRLRIIAALTDPASIRTYLEGVGLPAMPPPRVPPDLPSRPVAVAGRTAGCALNGPEGPGLIRIRADRQPNCTASSVLRARSKDWQTILRELPDLGGALSALTESPKKVPHFTYT